jgi:hypothetical protein
MIGIPILVVAGLTRRWTSRVLIAAAVVALAAVMEWSFRALGDIEPGSPAIAIVGLVVLIVAAITWGALSAWSWIVAALVYQVFGGLREAVYGLEWQARSAGVLTLLIAGALIALIVPRGQRSS